MRNWLRYFAVGAAVLFCCLLATELMLRALGWSYPLFARPDAELGWSFRPNTSGWSTHENTAYVHINRFGFRGEDWPEKPAPGTFRIAVLGDSMTDSSNLMEPDSLTAKVQAHLTTCPKYAARRVEVLNFGVSGYTTSQQYLQLQHRVAAFSPDMVLLAYSAASDVPENSRSLGPPLPRPYFVASGSGDPRHDESFRDSSEFRHQLRLEWLRRLVNASYLLQALKQVYLGNPIVPAPVKSHVFKLTGSAVPPRVQYPQLFAPPADEAWSSAWAVTEKLLVRMRDWLRARGIPFALTIIPVSIEALPSEELRHAVVQKYQLADLDYPSARIADFAAHNGIPHLNLLGALHSFGDRNRQFAFGFHAEHAGEGHLNAIGNEVVGGAIAAWLCSSGAGQERLN
jgi:lysophospholipase L1-like esterase